MGFLLTFDKTVAHCYFYNCLWDLVHWLRKRIKSVDCFWELVGVNDQWNCSHTEMFASINNSSSQQSNLSIQATKMKWTETKYLPGLRILPSSITFNFDMNPGNEDYVSSQEFIMNWIVTTETDILLWCNIELRTIGLIYMNSGWKTAKFYKILYVTEHFLKDFGWFI